MGRLSVAIRRRRKKLTNLVSRLDQRVRSVELRPVSLLISGEVESAIVAGEELRNPTNVVSDSAPNQFRKVEDAYYYSKGLTGGSEDRVTIYLESDLQLPVGGSIEISGIHGTSTTDIDVSGVFEVKFTDTEPWADRASWKHDPTQDQLPAVTITNEYSIKPDTLGPGTWGDTYRRLQTKRLVDMFSITGNTVTLTMNAVHKFKVDDVIYVDIFAENATAFGEDGLFKVTAVTSDTIEYELFAGVDTPTGDITPSADFYVYPVARNHLPIGSTWSDSSTNSIYVWDGIRWVDYSAAGVEPDDDPPSPPTNLQITSELKFFQTTTPVVEVTVGWDAPTTSESGEEITDLLGYTIKYRRSASEAWEVRDLPFTDTSYTFKAAADFVPDTLYSFEVYAYDSGNLYSEALTGTHTTPSAPSSNILGVRPTPPSVEVYLGTFTITWDGAVEDTNNSPQNKPDGLINLDIHISTSPGFAPNDNNRISTITSVSNAKYVYADVSYGSAYYIKFVLRDASNTSSLPSRQTTATAQSTVDASRISGIIAAANITPGTIVTGEKIIGLSITGQLIEGNEINGDVIKANSIEASRIQAGAITAKLVDGEVITTNSSDSDARVRITSAGIEAYNSFTRTFFLNAATGAVTIGGYATDGQLNAVANTASTANTTATSASNDASNAINDINSLEGNVYVPGTTEINGGNIRTGTIVADAIGAGTLKSNVIYSGSISATQVSAGTFTGSTLRTAVPNNERVLVSGSSHTIKFYEQGEDDLNESGVIEALASGLRVKGDGTSYVTVGGNLLILSATSSNEITIGNGETRVNGDFVTQDNYYAESGIYYESQLGFSESSRLIRILGSNGLLYDSNFTGSSDINLKEDVKNLNLGLNFINSLTPIEFKYKIDNLEDKSINFGISAQEIKQKLIEHGYQKDNLLVGKDKAVGDMLNYIPEGQDYVLGVNYDNFVPMLIKSIQELSHEVSNLKQRISKLEGS